MPIRRSLLHEALSAPSVSQRAPGGSGRRRGTDAGDAPARRRSSTGRFVDDGHALAGGRQAQGGSLGWATFAASDAGPFEVEDFSVDGPSPAAPTPVEIAPAGQAPRSDRTLVGGQHQAPRDEEIDADLDAIRAAQPPAGSGGRVASLGGADDAVEFLREARQTAPRPEAASRASADGAGGGTPSDEDEEGEGAPAAGGRGERADPHEIFERMGRSMAYSTSFDLGDVALSRRFEAFEAELEREEAPASSHPHPAALSDEDLDADVAAIVAGAPPAGPAPAETPTADAPAADAPAAEAPQPDAAAPAGRAPQTPPTPAGTPASSEPSTGPSPMEEGQEMSNRLAELERDITRQRDRDQRERGGRPGNGAAPDARQLTPPGPGPSTLPPAGPAPQAASMAQATDFEAARRRAIEAARQAGASDEELREFFGVDAPVAAAGYAGALGRTEITLPTPEWLDGWKRAAVDTLLAATPLGAVVGAARMTAARINATVGVGLVATAGLGSGGSFGAGVLVDARGLGYYGSQSVVMGWIASMTASIQLTVIKGDRSAFGGRAVAQAISLDLSEGPNVGASAIYTPSGRFIGVSASVGLSVGIPVLSAVEAYVEQQYTVAHGLAAVPQPAAFAAGALSVAMANEIPLDPGVGGRSIAQEALEVGDILLSTGSGVLSGAIRAATSSEVSHAALYIGNGEIVEAVGGGVERKSLAQAMADDTFVVAVRREGLTAQQRDALRSYAISAVGRPYDNQAIVNQAQFKILPTICDALPSGGTQLACRAYRGMVRLGPTTNDRFICSELVLRAFDAAGVALTSTDPEWGTPQELVDLHLSAVLAYVGHLKTP